MKFMTALIGVMCVTMSMAASPLRESTLREASRLAGLPQKPSADSDWSRVRKLKPGSPIVLVDRSSPAQQSRVQDRRYLIQTDGSSITVLNLTHIVLPPQVRGALRDLVENRPTWFLAAEHGRGFLLQDGVRVGPAGIFFSGKKVADLGQVLDRIAREDVLSIAARRKRTRGSEAQMAQGAVGGFLITMVGAAGGGTGPNFCTEHPNGCWPAIGLGSIAGTGLAYFSGNGRTLIDDVVVYRAP
jgi:hypothetical protein